MARPKSNGPYAPLSATYYRDDAILEVGEEAELMFVRSLAFLADAASDGFITERQMRIVVGMGLERVTERIDSLLSVGLVERIDGGFIVRSWLKWNKSTDEIGKHLKRDRERKSTGKVTDSSVIPDGIQTDSGDQYKSLQVTTSQVNTKDPPAVGEHFEDAWKHWPKKDDKKDALAKWPRAVAEFGQGESQLASIVALHGDAYREHRTKQFTPALIVWLNKARWDNEPPTVAEPTGRQTPEQRARQTLALATDIDMEGIEQ